MPLHLVGFGGSSQAKLADIVFTWIAPVGGTQRAHVCLVSRGVSLFPGPETLKVHHLEGLRPCTVKEVPFRDLEKEFDELAALGVRGDDLGTETRYQINRLAKTIKRRLGSSPKGNQCVYGFEPTPVEEVAIPDVNNQVVTLYTFSCATFVNHCYCEALDDQRALVDVGALPPTTDHERDPAFKRLGLKAGVGVRRLFPGYLMEATRKDAYPLADFTNEEQPCRFPYQVLASLLRERLQHGKTDEFRLRLAAHLGRYEASEVLQDFQLFEEYADWLRALVDGWEPRIAVAAILAIAETAFEAWEDRTDPIHAALHVGESGEEELECCALPRRLHDIAESWLADPSEAATAKAQAALDDLEGHDEWLPVLCGVAVRMIGGETEPTDAASALLSAIEGRDEAGVRSAIRDSLLPWALGSRDRLRG